MGDIDYMDIDDPDLLQGIDAYITQARSQSQPVHNDMLPKSSIDIPFEITKVAVLDTNFLLSHLALLSSLFRTESSFPSLMIVVPWIVIQELDGLKNTKKVTLTKSNSMHASDIGTLARKATNFIYDHLSESRIGKAAIFRGQRLDETLETRQETNDDLILDCCRFFFKKIQKPVFLLSRDKNLMLKAAIHGIQTPPLNSTLSQTLLGSLSDIHHPVVVHPKSTGDSYMDMDIDDDPVIYLNSVTENLPISKDATTYFDDLTPNDFMSFPRSVQTANDLMAIVQLESTRLISDGVISHLKKIYPSEYEYEYIISKYPSQPWTPAQLWSMISDAWFPNLIDIFPAALERKLQNEIVPRLKLLAQDWERGRSRGSKFEFSSRRKIQSLIDDLDIFGKIMIKREIWISHVDKWRNFLPIVQE